MKTRIDISPEVLRDFCRRHGIRKLSVFGSALRPDFRPDSDIDVLVEFEDGHTTGFLGLGQIQRELSELLGGREVDLRTPKELSRYFRETVVAEAEVQYVAG